MTEHESTSMPELPNEIADTECGMFADPVSIGSDPVQRG